MAAPAAHLSRSRGARRLKADLVSPGTVVVVGSINVDFVVRVAVLPVPGETVTGGAFERHQGGKGANQAVAAARMGARVTFVGAVGDDEFGREALVDLERERIDVSRVSRIDAARTGVALIVVDERGENQIAVASGANSTLNAQRVRAAFAGPGMQRSGVMLANLEIPDAAVVAAAQAAVERGMRVVINPAPARELPAELLLAAPILVLNEAEAEALSGERDPSTAARTLAATTSAPVVVTLGAAGALVALRGGVEHVPAPSVEVVDTTGAGDTFCGALCAELAAGAELLEAARVAIRAASRSVTASGARGAMPTRKELQLG